MSVTQQRASFSLRERARYRFDNIIARGTLGMIGLLFVFTVVFLLVVATLLALFGVREAEDEDAPPLSFREAFWQAMLRTLDPGTMGGDSGWTLRISSLIVTLMGLFIVSILIGILVSGLEGRLAALQRGRGRIAVAGHTLVLGWSPKVMTILSELSIAKESQRNGSVVILADQDKQMMDDVIAARLPKGERRGLNVVTRTGEPHEATDLAIVNPDLAHSIIVLSDEASSGDAGVIKTVLALINERALDPSIPVVAEIASSARAQALRSVTKGRVAVIQPGEVIARTAAQASREAGLNLVFQELFDFDGDEIYFSEVPQTAGMRFGDILNCFEKSCVIGLTSAAGEVRVHPPSDTVINPGDKIILIAEDDSAVAWSGPIAAAAPNPAIGPGQAPAREPEKLLMFGWNPYGHDVVTELSEYVAPGSSLMLVIDPHIVSPEDVDAPHNLSNLSVDVRFIPDAADPVGTMLNEVECDHVMILCYRSDQLTSAEAESRSLMTFLEARHMLEKMGRDVNVTAELLDERDVELIPQASGAEFMVSERLASLLMSQLSENIGLEAVFVDLLDADGSEIYCKPVEYYTQLGAEVTFADMVEAAKARDEIAIGWQQVALRADASQGFGVIVNPAKSHRVTFAGGDQLVVLAEEDS